MCTGLVYFKPALNHQCKNFISCINIFQSWDPLTENALCPCDVLQNPILHLCAPSGSACIIVSFTKLHKTEGALLRKHLKIYFSHDTFLQFVKLSICHFFKIWQWFGWFGFLSIIFTARLYSISIFLIKESLVWDQTVIQYEIRDNHYMQEQMSCLKSNVMPNKL